MKHRRTSHALRKAEPQERNQQQQEAAGEDGGFATPPAMEGDYSSDDDSSDLNAKLSSSGGHGQAGGEYVPRSDE